MDSIQITMKLIIMTQPTFFVEEDKILTSLFEEGLDCLHLYKPGSPPMYAERLLTLLSSDFYSKIVVHNHFYLKEEYKLKGIHIDDENLPVPNGYKGKISRTCTDLSLLKEAKRHSEYVFLKNIFDCQNYSDEKSSFTANELENAARKGLIDRHVYALGGMNIDNIRVAKDLGFGGVVICSDLWSRFNIHQELDYKELISHFEKLKKTIG